ncbi:hypothetical protein SUGI_0998370 [Cryptomeria japonica]|nr:hypothetical protein SUGI_0998370 [Cryptomeria japonica]
MRCFKSKYVEHTQRIQNDAPDKVEMRQDKLGYLTSQCNLFNQGPPRVCRNHASLEGHCQETYVNQQEELQNEEGTNKQECSNRDQDKWNFHREGSQRMSKSNRDHDYMSPHEEGHKDSEVDKRNCSDLCYQLKANVEDDK